MENKFFTESRVIDFKGIKLSVQESNSKTSDRAFTKYTFPFEFYIDSGFVQGFGDFEGYDIENITNKISGFMLYKGKVRQAEMNINSIIGKKITAQIDFGFEELPNWNKKLSELPLEKFEVADIHTFAKEICAKSYPQANFNFPRMYTAKFPPDQKSWDAFDGYYNDLEKDGSAMRRNTIDAQGNIFNVNIIHPTPHLLYLLKTGFLDAGFQLKGDVLSDSFFTNAWVFSGTQYFSDKHQWNHRWKFNSDEAEELFLENGPDDYARYDKYMSLEKPGRYKIAGILHYFRARKMMASYQILLNDKPLFKKTDSGNRDTILQDIPINIEFNVTEPNSTLHLFIYNQYHDDWKLEMADLLVTSTILDDSAPSEGESTDVIQNLNVVDLTKAVPDITFGDLLNIMRNWFNYDYSIEDNAIYMNKIGEREPENVKDARFMEVQQPERVKLSERSFLLRFPELENYKLDSAYYDSKGLAINKEPKADTKIIDINGYAMPVELPKKNGYTTAVVKKDSSDLLALVYYKGLSGGQNNAVAPPSVYFPDLFITNWEKWLWPRLDGWQFKWSVNGSEDMEAIDIKDYIYAYNNVHVITDWTLDYDLKTLKNSITTETMY